MAHEKYDDLFDKGQDKAELLANTFLDEHLPKIKQKFFLEITQEKINQTRKQAVLNSLELGRNAFLIFDYKPYFKLTFGFTGAYGLGVLDTTYVDMYPKKAGNGYGGGGYILDDDQIINFSPEHLWAITHEVNKELQTIMIEYFWWHVCEPEIDNKLVNQNHDDR